MSEPQSLPRSVYELDYFENEGFHRRECVACGDMFWTRDENRTSCGEPPCGDYTFVGKQNLRDSFSIEEVREEFLSFFEQNGHERVKPYPVAANRWREDVLLTQASIYNFQPLVTSGRTSPPSNPLCVSQPCIRMNDLENVGRTGRHTTAFEMLGHHAFNARPDADAAYEGEEYWKEETVEYCDSFFAHMGAELDEVVYIEDPWVGGGNAGPAFEVIYKGLELATLVFMSLEKDPNGKYELKDGNRYSEMDTYVVDTGYGLERWAWISQGTPTVYESVYPELITELKEDIELSYTNNEEELIRKASLEAGRLDTDSNGTVAEAREEIATELGVSPEELTELMLPLEKIFAIADHTRALAYMLGDEIIPSSNGTGYLARRILRRSLRMLDELEISVDIATLVEHQASRLGYENIEHIREVAETEASAYEETRRHGREHVRTLSERYDEVIPEHEIRELYESYGMQPETVKDLLDADSDLEVETPDSLNESQSESEKDSKEEITVEKERPPTELLFYDNQRMLEFEATVEVVTSYGEKHAVVLDKTAFYPEGGGQPADSGKLVTGSGECPVSDVQKHNGTVYHVIEEKPTGISEGQEVNGEVNGNRRTRHMQHHTATHIVGAAARNVLGDHIKQAGTQKTTKNARLDITHHRTLTRDDIEKIESYANRVVRENHPVGQDWVSRRQAEDEHGFSIYQGGIPPGDELRLIEVGDDIQACAGTHVSETGKVGTITVTNVTTVRDGVVRLTFAAGEAALDYIQKQRQLLDKSADVFDVLPERLPETANRFFNEWKEQQDRIDELQQEVSRLRVTTKDTSFTVSETPVVTERVDIPTDELVPMANAIAENGRIAVLISVEESVSLIVQTPEGIGIDAGKAANELASLVGGSGGGDQSLGQGGGPEVENADSILRESESLLSDLA